MKGNVMSESELAFARIVWENEIGRASCRERV